VGVSLPSWWRACYLAWPAALCGCMRGPSFHASCTHQYTHHARNARINGAVRKGPCTPPHFPAGPRPKRPQSSSVAWTLAAGARTCSCDSGRAGQSGKRRCSATDTLAGPRRAKIPQGCTPHHLSTFLPRTSPRMGPAGQGTASISSPEPAHHCPARVGTFSNSFINLPSLKRPWSGSLSVSLGLFRSLLVSLCPSSRTGAPLPSSQRRAPRITAGHAHGSCGHHASCVMRGVAHGCSHRPLTPGTRHTRHTAPPGMLPPEAHVCMRRTWGVTLTPEMRHTRHLLPAGLRLSGILHRGGRRECAAPGRQRADGPHHPGVKKSEQGAV
jgi:hypothetical protein